MTNVHISLKKTTFSIRRSLLSFPGNGSDVFGSDICTCKPYLVYAIEECIHTAQRGGVGVVVYFRKEGRALGEVTKCVPCSSSLTATPLDISFRYLVYNLRKRGGDSADKYFKSTELIAGVKDMRFQALMPDVLHWLGIRKIDNMISMSDMFVFRGFFFPILQ
jgi:GTP cyclohydrolase II